MAGRPSELQYVETPMLNQLENLGWTVVQLNDSEKHEPNKSFRESFSEIVINSRLKGALKRLNPWLNDVQINDLCRQMQDYPHHMNQMLENNEEVYERITEGLSADNEETGERNCKVRIVDWPDSKTNDKTENDFLAISQYKVRIPGKEEHIIPDIVLFVNGLPLVVIECKAPDIAEPMAEGIDQLMRYQNRRDARELEGVPELFYYNQLVISTCFHDCRYSSISGGFSHFMEWKDPYPYKLSEVNPNGRPSKQEITVAGMLEPSHLLDIVRNFIAYKDTDNGTRVKLVPRYMQYRGTCRIINRLRNADKAQKGGTLWHTQGTGKTLTMMFVIRKMFNSVDLKNYKVVLIIDRKDLQDQMFKTTKTVKYAVNIADSIDGAKSLIANTASDVTVAMVHKFGEQNKNRASDNTNKSGSLLEKKAASAFPILNESENILVMIDEAHRSEYSELAANMWKSMPNSVKVAFTGTPITKTVENFGGYIDTYTMRRGEEDGIVVPIKYEGRAADSEITDHEAMNRAFVDVFNYLEDEEKTKILGKYTVRSYLEAEEVIKEKAADMVDHYINTVFTNGFKAQVVGASKEAAYRYKNAIDEILPKKIAELEQNNPNNINIGQLKKLETACIISSGSANEDQHLKQYTDEARNKMIVDGFKAPFGEKGLMGGNGNYGILIVTAMLLTGFDAPVEQVMYLDKKLTNHNLLQAITRVNRTCGADKKCGYLVDYVGVTNHLKEALSDYTKEDQNEILKSIHDKAKDIDDLNLAYNKIIRFLKDKVGYELVHTSDIVEELCVDEELREEFNKLISNMSKFFDRVLPDPAALKYSEDYKTLAFIRESVSKMTRNPRFSNKDASKKVRLIIEKYLNVKGVSMEIAPVPLLSEDFIVDIKVKSDRVASEEIKYAVYEYINNNMPKDPELYTRLSERLEQILEEYKNNWAEQRKALEQLRCDLIAGRANENTFGLDATREMPFLGLLKTEFFGNASFDELSEDQINVMKDLTADILIRFAQETTAVNFWNNLALQQDLRTFIIKQLISPEVQRLVPGIVSRRKDIAQKIMELGYQHFGRND